MDSPRSEFTCTLDLSDLRPKENFPAENWRKFIRTFVAYALDDRHILTITDTPQKWSLGWELPAPKKIEIDRRVFLTNRIFRCNSEFRDELCSDDEFRRSLIWIVPDNDTDEVEVIRNCIALDIYGMNDLTADFEILLMLDDGFTLIWLCPQRPTETLRKNIQALAQESDLKLLLK